MMDFEREQALDHYWMPFTPNRKFKASPRMLASAQGVYYQTEEGSSILDGTSGLWCVNAGHGRASITEAVARQLTTLDYASSYQMAHPEAFRFAERLTKIAPDGLDRIFFTNSGSESVDTALKVALAYQRSIGQGSRTRLIGRERSYHGVGFGGHSVGGIVNNRRAFTILPGTDHMRHTHDLARNAFSPGLPEHGEELADDLQRLVDLHGAETIAAVIIEPVAGSAGVLLPPKGYLERLRDIATANGILLIYDEVITGFGRLGASFAAEYFGVIPDIIVSAKGLTNGTIPMGAVFVQRTIHDAMMQGPESAIEFFHGYTYSGHPVACAAGLAALDIYEGEGLLMRASHIGPVWHAALSTLADCPHVIDIRMIGLMAGIELNDRAEAPGQRAYEVFTRCFEQGLLVRVTGNVIALCPPLVIEQSEMGQMMDILRDVLNKAA